MAAGIAVPAALPAEDLAEAVSGVQNVQNKLCQQGTDSAGRSSKAKSSQS